MNLQEIIPHLEQATGKSLKGCRIGTLGGGDINSACHVKADGISWFVKVNRPGLAKMFEAEAVGLRELAATNTVRVPVVVANGRSDGYSFLALEHIELGRLDGKSASHLGERMAALHGIRQAFFGWHIDNTIGSTDQYNERYDDWVKFWRDKRLSQQLRFAADNGFGGRLQNRGEKLLDVLDAFFTDYRPHPSLLHGDLWGGNAASDPDGQPVIYDPACYYGDREADIAMTELFGGFNADFYRAYDGAFALDPGYPTRKMLYNLYHIINHLNLFGSAYLHQAESMIDRLLAEC